jgi:hypothetical protein
MRALEESANLLLGSYQRGEDLVKPPAHLGHALKAARAGWLRVKELEDSEQGHRDMVVEATRSRGITMARLVMEGGDDGFPSAFILTIPTEDGADLEAKVATHLQRAVHLVAGSIIHEHQATKGVLFAILAEVGAVLEKPGSDLTALTKLLKECDVEGLALHLNMMSEGGE